jgi:hypothetical protein
MNGFTDYTKNALLDALVGKSGSFGALESAPPLYLALFNGATEISGNGYSRLAVANTKFNSASAGLISNSDELLFSQATAAWGQITDLRVYNASTGGNILLQAPLIDTSTIKTFVADAGTDILTVPNHLFTNGQTVRLMGNLSGGLSADTTYYVVGAAADVIQLAATSGGTAINFTADVYGEIAVTAYKTVEANDQVRFAPGALKFTLL